ncbi:hypothetical protein ACOMHN_007170 [Nucella lapillus]
MSLVTVDLENSRTWLTQLFHGFPHLDFSFSDTSATFNPENEKYREALLVWAAVPLLCCAVFFLLHVIFFCVRCCCCSKRAPARTGRCGKAEGRRCCPLSGVLLLLGCAALAVVMYGNTEIHQGLDNSVRAMRSTRRTIDSSQHIMNALARISLSVEGKWVPELISAVRSISNSTAVDLVVDVIWGVGQGVNSSLQSVLHVTNSTATQLHPEVLAGQMEALEYLRWVLVIVVCCLYTAIFLLVFAALLMRSRKKLILGTVLTIVLLPTLWGMLSVHLALAVGSGDLCDDPNSFVLTQLNNTVDEDLLRMYMECADKSLPFGKDMLDAQTAMSQAMTALGTAVNMTAPFNISNKLLAPVSAIQMDLQSMFGNLSLVNALVGSCQTLHDHYTQGLQGTCHTSLFGAGYLLVPATLLSLCSVCLVFCCAVAWRFFGKGGWGREDGYEPMDDTDPFVPGLRSRPQPGYGAIASGSPEEAAYLTDAVNINDGDGLLYHQDLMRDSPPTPHYPSILEEYADLAPRPYNVGRCHCSLGGDH